MYLFELDTLPSRRPRTGFKPALLERGQSSFVGTSNIRYNHNVDNILPRAFYERPTLEVARDLLGQILVFRHQRCRIVETEAYSGLDDRASHAARGRTKRSEIMFGPAGYAYIYLIYGMYNCLNIVTERQDFPSAVLIRAAEPLGRGPGVLCRELGLTREHNGADVTGGSELRIDRGSPVPEQVLTSPRIGVDYAGEWAMKPWRFYLEGNPWVSGPKRRVSA